MSICLAKRALANSCPNDVEELVEDVIGSINAIRISTRKLRGCNPDCPLFALCCRSSCWRGAPLWVEELSRTTITWPPETNIYLRTVISSDNSRVFFNSGGAVFYIDTATDARVNATVDENCCYGDYDLALSANQSQFEGSGYLYDLDLNAESYFALNDREIMNISYVYGVKSSADSRLLFQPTTNGIDVMDGRLGNLVNRVALSVSLSQNYDALVSDAVDSVLIAITGTGDGIAIVDLTSIKEGEHGIVLDSSFQSTAGPCHGRAGQS